MERRLPDSLYHPPGSITVWRDSIRNAMVDSMNPEPTVHEVEDVEGLDLEDKSWGNYPIDDILIRQDSRTVYEVARRIKNGRFVMDPDFQRDFIWADDKQSKLIESVIMRIPLPVFYLAEDDEGRNIVVDGLQRLSTFNRFLDDSLKLRLADRPELNGKKFTDLSSKLQNRIEDCSLRLYVIDSKVPERARLDIFERVNGGVPLTRQQMRNSLFMGPATRFLKSESRTDIFKNSTGKSLNSKTMRDREFVNRFCAFHILGYEDYRGDMDKFLAESLRRMNKYSPDKLSELSVEFRRGLENNLLLFERHAFRKFTIGENRRSVLNASIWDVMSTGLSRYPTWLVDKDSGGFVGRVSELLADDDFSAAITHSTNDTKRVQTRFKMAEEVFKEVLGAYMY